MATEQENNKRIAKNTLLLYVRTMFVMAVSLFTSRVVLNALGVENFGTYNVVGGFVAMFSVISGALSSSISRFLTFELGKGGGEKLNRIFSTSVNIQIVIGAVVFILGEIAGLWFLNYKANIPDGRLWAAVWVLQCSLIAFVVNLVSVPYNAAIIAHEKMKAFAYIGVLEAVLKLLVAYSLYISSWDKLVTYAVLLVLISVMIRLIYGIYCHRNFSETRYKFCYDKELVHEMTGFAGWSFFTNSAFIFNTQGVNLLINVFFGVASNAARGIAIQMEAAIKKFVLDFTTAINPQITKNYAAGKIAEMNKLICRGSRFSYLLFLTFALPFVFETPTVLKLWLNVVPEHTVAFFRLSIICTLVDLLGNTGYTACMATGKIKKYVLTITSVGCLVFPLSWLAYYLGFPVESCYVVFALVYLVVDIVRLFLMKQMLDFPPFLYIRDVVFRIFLVTLFSLPIPFFITEFMEPSVLRFFVNTIVCVLIASLSSFFFGLSKNEKLAVQNGIRARFLKKWVL